MSIFFDMEMLTIVYLPHIEILLLFGLKKEAFVAVFDFTHLEVTAQTVSWCWESDTRLNTKCVLNNFRKYIHWPRLSQTTCPSCPFWYLMDNGKCFFFLMLVELKHTHTRCLFLSEKTGDNSKKILNTTDTNLLLSEASLSSGHSSNASFWSLCLLRKKLELFPCWSICPVQANS